MMIQGLFSVSTSISARLRRPQNVFNVKPEAYNPEAYNFVAVLVFFRESFKIYFLIWNYW